MAVDFILHLARDADFWRDSESGVYRPPNFARDGFIHCTREPELMLEVANRFYRDAQGEMIVLVIDPARRAADGAYLSV